MPRSYELFEKDSGYPYRLAQGISQAPPHLAFGRVDPIRREMVHSDERGGRQANGP